MNNRRCAANDDAKHNEAERGDAEQPKYHTKTEISHQLFTPRLAKQLGRSLQRPKRPPPLGHDNRHHHETCHGPRHAQQTRHDPPTHFDRSSIIRRTKPTVAESRASPLSAETHRGFAKAISHGRLPASHPQHRARNNGGIEKGDHKIVR